MVLWAIARGFCCCFGRKAAVGPGEKKRIRCPACGQPAWVAFDSLQPEARCSCDVLREKAEAGARRGRAGAGGGAEGARGDVMSEGFSTRVLSRLDPEHASTCVHCGVSFCTPCDVRDNRRTFPFLVENNRERKQGETRAARQSESRKAKQVRNALFSESWLSPEGANPRPETLTTHRATQRCLRPCSQFRYNGISDSTGRSHPTTIDQASQEGASLLLASSSPTRP